MNLRVIARSEFNALDVREWQLSEGQPRFPVVAREPKAGTRRAFSQGHVDPAGARRMKIAAKSLGPLAADALPGLAAVAGKV